MGNGLRFTAADLRRKGFVIDDQLGTGAPRHPIRSSHRQPLPPDVLVITMGGTSATPPGVHQLTFPQMRLVSEANRADHEHWTVRHRRAKEQRYTVYYNLRCTYWPIPQLPCTITLTRIAPRSLEENDLIQACEAIRFGVADWFAGAEGEGQPEQEGLIWKHESGQGKPKEYDFWITIFTP